MNNDFIASQLEQLADLLEFQGANAFRLNAYRNGARVIRDINDSVTAMVERGDDLTKFAGIGKGVAEKCAEIAQTGKLAQLEELKQEIPPTVLDLLRVPKLGPKKAAIVFKQLNISTLDQLKAACEAEQLRQIKGFGAKTEQAILEGIEIASAANMRIYWSDADAIANQLREHFKDCKAIKRLEFAGSYRRGKETIGDLDILIDSDDSDSVMDRFGQFELIESVSGRGDTKMSVRLNSGFQVDLRVVPHKSFGAALQYFTGSKEHNVQVRSIAKRKEFKVNEWGVFSISEGQEQYIAGESESDVYKVLGLPCFPPELREARREFEWAETGQLPDLIELSDIQGDLHMHTTQSDGRATFQEMVAAAEQRNLKYIAITDHSKRVSMANGLDADRLLAQWKMIDQWNAQKNSKVWVFKGVECDILENGEMDIAEDVLAQADWVIASVHYGQEQSEDQITGRIKNALQNPNIHAIAHPTGRLINRRKPYKVNLEEVFRVAAENGKFLELNASSKRLDLNDIHLAAASSLGIPIVINTDAHHTKGLDSMRFGINQARRGGLTAKDVVNTKSLAQFKKIIA
jgi:DNA polymerase (family X)